MENFKGTKGSWFIKGRVNLFVYGSEIENGITIDYPIAKIDDFDKSVECKKANAKLIASAPELLEALQSLMEVHEAKGNLLNFDVNIARQAIKSATS